MDVTPTPIEHRDAVTGLPYGIVISTVASALAFRYMFRACESTCSWPLVAARFEIGCRRAATTPGRPETVVVHLVYTSLKLTGWAKSLGGVNPSRTSGSPPVTIRLALRDASQAWPMLFQSADADPEVSRSRLLYSNVALASAVSFVRFALVFTVTE